MKKIIDDEGKTQVSFLDAPTIDCKFLPSKKALEFRLSQLVDMIQKGDFDYARYRGWKGLTVEQGDRHLKTKVLIEGEWWSLAQVRGIQRFMKTWQARRQYLLDDAEGLQRSIALAVE